MVPIIDPAGLYGALFDPLEGNLDPNGATQAYAGAARKRGAEVIQHNRVLSLTPLPERRDGGSRPSRATIIAEHVVNAAGLWARKVGNMVGVDHPLVPMQHHYLVTGGRAGGRCDRGRHAGGDRPRGLHLPAAGRQRRAARRLRAEPAPLEGRGRRLGLRPDALPGGARPHHARALDRLRAASPCCRTSASAGG